MNIVILTMVLFFNGTTHVETVEYTGMVSCAHDLNKWVEVFEDKEWQGTLPGPNDMKLLSIQCTVKPLKE